jgi:hypothetical protein
VPPPISTTIEPVADETGKPARQRLADQAHFPCTRRHRGFLDGPAFDLGRPRRHTDRERRPAAEELPRPRHIDELPDHVLCGGEIGDHAMPHGPYRLEIIGRPAEQLLGLAADRRHPPAPRLGMPLETHHGRLIQHDPAVVGIDKRIGRAEVDRHRVTKQSPEQRMVRLRSGHR